VSTRDICPSCGQMYSLHVEPCPSAPFVPAPREVKDGARELLKGKKPAQPEADWRDTACENIERALASAPREWYLNPVAGYKCEVNENGIGLTGNEVHVIEHSAYERVVKERDELRAAGIKSYSRESHDRATEWQAAG
jgi:hypothetical protein